MPKPVKQEQSVTEWMKDNQITAGVGLWLASLIGTGAYMWRRPGISVANKLIHMRMVAQAALITGLCGVGIAGFLSNDKPAEDQANPMQIRMKQFDDLAPKTQKSE